MVQNFNHSFDSSDLQSSFRASGVSEELASSCSIHNIIQGAVISGWSGYVMSSDMPLVVKRALQSHSALTSSLEVLQYILFVNGMLLILSGILIRFDWRVGYYLAVLCAAVLVGGGIFFFGTYKYLLDDSSAIFTLPIYYARANLDLIYGFIDGIFLFGLLFRMQKSRSKNRFS